MHAWYNLHILCIDVYGKDPIMKKTIQTMLIGALCIFSLMPYEVNAYESADAEIQASQTTAYDVAKILNPAAVEYLNEFYIEKYPEAALRFKYGTDEDEAALQKLSSLIIEKTGAVSDAEKTNAVIGWVRANIDYSANASVFPADTFASRRGSCLSDCLLITQLLRLQSVKAVTVDGYRADLRQFGEGDLYTKLVYEGHAWIYVYINGQWTMFDPLWHGEVPLTDDEYIASYYFPDTIEGISIVEKGKKTSYTGRQIINVYEDGIFMNYNGGRPGQGNSTYMLNNIDLSVTVHTERDGFYYPDDPEEAGTMREGQIYSGGRWIAYANENYLMYCYENGIHPAARIMEFGGHAYYMDGGFATRLADDFTGYWFEGGMIAVPVGYSGYIFGPNTYYNYGEEIVRTWKLSDINYNENVTLSSDGKFDIRAEGLIIAEYEARSAEDGRLMSGGFEQIYASAKKPVFDYTFHTFNIAETCRIEMEEGPYFYMDEPVCPKVSVYEPQILDNTKFRPLSEGIDYTVTYENNSGKGTAYAIIRGKGNYSGEVRISYKIDAPGILPESIALSASSLEIKAGSTKRLNAVIAPEGAQVTLKWTSSRPEVASVDNGLITAKRGGTARITAETVNGLKAQCEVTVLFKDAANKSKYYFEPVYWAADLGITTGTGPAEFAPELEVTRGQMVTFLWRLAGSPKPSSTADFIDVPAGKFYAEPVAWANENNITTGYNDGRFGPDDRCTREQIVTFLWRYAGMPAPTGDASFKDVKSGAWYHKAVSWAAENNITNGLNDGTQRFGVGMPCTRAMAVTFLYRYAKS